MLKAWFPDTEDKFLLEDKEILEEVYCMFFAKFEKRKDFNLEENVLTQKNNYMQGIYG